MEPQILVFDEPFSNLDYPGITQVLENILKLHQEGHTIILTTHDLEKVIVHADRLVIMQNGKIEKDDKPEQLYDVLENFGIRQPCATRFGLELEPWIK